MREHFVTERDLRVEKRVAWRFYAENMTGAFFAAGSVRWIALVKATLSILAATDGN